MLNIHENITKNINKFAGCKNAKLFVDTRDPSDAYINSVNNVFYF